MWTFWPDNGAREKVMQKHYPPGALDDDSQIHIISLKFRVRLFCLLNVHIQYDVNMYFMFTVVHEKIGSPFCIDIYHYFS